MQGRNNVGNECDPALTWVCLFRYANDDGFDVFRHETVASSLHRSVQFLRALPRRGITGIRYFGGAQDTEIMKAIGVQIPEGGHRVETAFILVAVGNVELHICSSRERKDSGPGEL